MAGRRLAELTARPWLQAALTFGLALAGAVLAHRLWLADISVPFAYHGDGLQYLMYAKSIHDVGWMLENGNLGVPFGLRMFDWPEGGWFSLIGLRLLDLATGNYVVAHHLLYLLGYPLAALAAWWGLRRLGIAAPLAVALSVLYALLPYHLARGEGHYVLSLYYGLPPLLSYAVTTAAGRAPMPLGGGLSRRRRLARVLPAIGAAVLAGLMSIYYVAFAGLLLAAAGVFGWLRSGRVGVLASAAVLVLVLATAMLAQYAGPLAHQLALGANNDVASRYAGEVESYPLKPADLLLPVPGHPLAPLASVRAEYMEFPSRSQPGVALGMVGGVGLLLALAGFVAGVAGRAPYGSLRARLVPLGWLAGVGVAIGMLGGAATFMSLLVGPYLRAWDRIGVAIAFVALAAVGVAITRARHAVRRPARGPLLAGLAALLLAGGALDQAATTHWLPDYDQTARRWHADSRFIAAAEASVPAGTSVAVLPYVPFPEQRQANVGVNELLRPYLHSRTLRWSHGYIAGREPGWQPIAAATALPLRLEFLRQLGFGAVYVDLSGYAAADDETPSAGEVMSELEALIGPPAVVREDGQLAFFVLHPPLADAEVRRDAYDPIWLRWASGFGRMLVRGEHAYHSVGQRSTLELRNDRDAPRDVVVRFVLASPDAEPRAIEVEWPDGATETVAPGARPTVVQRRVRLPAGRSQLRLRAVGDPPRSGALMLDVAAVDPSMERFLPSWPGPPGEP